MIKTPNYVLQEDHSFNQGTQDVRTLPAGTFVRPIEFRYLPRHITDKNQEYERSVYCYTRYGIISIPRHKIREV